MAEKLRLAERTERVESGAVQFVYANGDEDWRGWFLRGDNALALALALKHAAQRMPQETMEDSLAVGQIFALADDILRGVPQR